LRLRAPESGPRGLLAPEQPLQTYAWSSYPLYQKEPPRRPAWLRVDRLLGEWGIPADSAAGRAEFAGRMEARRRAEGLGDYEPEGRYLGSDEFRQELLAQVDQQAGPRHVGEEVSESAQTKAERIVREELQLQGWGAQELQRRRKGDPHKVRVAARLRCETTMTLAWIAQRLHMGSAGHIGHLLYRKEANKLPLNAKNTRILKLSCSDPVPAIWDSITPDNSCNISRSQ
jgi:hypothetical protein